MSIASELNNLEGNIEDSYDAVNDMGGVIPAQRNMDNLDQAIRTIPQNQGTTYTAGNGIDITNDVISIDDTVVAELSDIPTVNDATLTIQHNGTNVQTFSANSSTNKTANVETIWADPITSTAALTPPIQTNMLADGAVTSAKIGWSTMEHWTLGISGNQTVTQGSAYNYVDVPGTSKTLTMTVGGVYLVMINAAVRCVGNSADCYARVVINGAAVATALGTNSSGQYTAAASAQMFTATQASNTVKIQIGGGRANSDYTIAGDTISSAQIMRIA